MALATLMPMVALHSIVGTATALGEELGWRGLLVPQLARTQGFTAVALTSGAVWAVWQYPLIVLGIVDTSGVPMLRHGVIGADMKAAHSASRCGENNPRIIEIFITP